MHGNSTSKAAKKIYNSIELSDNKGTLKNIQSIVEPKSWVDYASYITIKSPDLKNLRKLLILSRIELIINKMDDILYECLISVKYLKPLRATAERYYRRVDLAVSEIDPEGKNLPIFLDSLTQTQLTNFRNWLQENIGIDVKTEKESGQIILLARTSTDTELVNVADMGFGISQILPFAAQLWASIYSGKNSFSNTAFLVVEQPELHLHPAFQAKIANLLAGVISINKSQKSKKPIKLIIETHSQHLINRLGSLIEDDIISESDVSIVIIEPDKENPGTSKTRISKFNSDGVLENWPIGFFDSEE
jgi:predicted ATP-dependent endonuclease of OLD family